MAAELNARTAIVTGASRGIGLAIAEARRRALEDERNAARTGIPAARIVEGLIAQARHVLFEAGL